MNVLFNERRFIQSLVETILSQSKLLCTVRKRFCDNRKRRKLVRNIFEINKTCYYFGIQNCLYSIIAHNRHHDIYNKEYIFRTFQELEKSWLGVTNENDYEYGDNDWVEFSAYREYRMRDGSKRLLMTYFESINFNCHGFMSGTD